MEDQEQSRLVLVGMQGAVYHMASALEQVVGTLGWLVAQQKVTNDLLHQAGTGVAAPAAAAAMAHGGGCGYLCG